MPELPEVETTLQGIGPFLKDQSIEKLIVRQPRLRYILNDDFNEQVTGKKINAISRRAKYLILELSSGYILIHLGMSGHLRILQTAQPAQKHDHIDLVLTNGTILRYCDPRRFGLWLYLENNPYQHRFLNHLGPEPLSEGFNANYLKQCIKNKKLSVKSLIMRNDIVVGVGNIYATESLFLAGIHPETSANRLSDSNCEALVYHIKKVLQKAIDSGGTTLKDFYSSEGKPGYFAQELQVYGRSKQPCFKCKTTIEAIKTGGRTTSFCPCCQSMENMNLA